MLHIKCASCPVYILKGEVCGYRGACVPGHVAIMGLFDASLGSKQRVNRHK